MMPRSGAMTVILDLTPLEASDVLFELVLTHPAARDRALAIAQERTRGARPAKAPDGGPRDRGGG